MMLMVLALLTAAPATQTAQQRDLSCVAALTSVMTSVPEAKRDAVASLVMFYVGRLEGRDPAIDLTEAMEPIISDEKAFTAARPAELKRCGAEMEVKGAALVTMGEKLKQRAAR